MSKKETFYFSHDYHARDDRKMKKLRLKHRMVGVGIYWSIIEMLYEEDGCIPLSEVPFIAEEFGEEESLVNSIINDFDLFKVNKKLFYSESVKRRLAKRFEKSVKAKESANAKWDKIRNANGMRTHSECNAIKESKVKERKINKSKGKESVAGEPPLPKNDFEVREKKFYEDLAIHVKTYGKEMLRAFYDYWREPNKSRSKMKWEQESTWELSLRLKKWEANEHKFNKGAIKTEAGENINDQIKATIKASQAKSVTT